MKPPSETKEKVLCAPNRNINRHKSSLIYQMHGISHTFFPFLTKKQQTNKNASDDAAEQRARVRERKKGKIINKLSELLVLRKHEKGRSGERVCLWLSLQLEAKCKREDRERGTNQNSVVVVVVVLGEEPPQSTPERRLYEGTVHSPLKIYFQNTHSLNENCCLGFWRGCGTRSGKHPCRGSAPRLLATKFWHDRKTERTRGQGEDDDDDDLTMVL